MLLSILPIQSRAEGTAESAIPQDGTFAGGPLQQITLRNSAEFYIGKGCSFVVADLMNAGFTSIQVLETAEASDDTVKEFRIQSLCLRRRKRYENGNKKKCLST